MSEYFDEQDTQDPRLRAKAQFVNLAHHLQDAVQNCPGLANHLTGIDLSAIVSAMDSNINAEQSLQSLPVLRKSALMQAQQENPPFGGFVNESGLDGCRVFMSPGPVWEPQVGVVDPWQAARALHAAGFRRGDRVHNTFSYHVTPGGFMLDEGARALGCSVFPSGTSPTEQQLETMRTFAATAFVGTPDYLLNVLNKADELMIYLPALKRAMVSGGPLFPAMRKDFDERGIAVRQCYATADLGVIAYETSTDDVIHPGMLLNEHLIVEIVKPGSGDPVESGEVGEIVVTRLHPVYPLVRFATGDMSAFIDEPSPCGRTARRIKGWMGRADQRTKVRGMFVDPSQIQTLRKEHADISALRLVVTRTNDKDVMTLQVNTHSSTGKESATIEAITDSLKRITGLSGEVQWQGEPLPNDGVVIDDQRKIG